MWLLAFIRGGATSRPPGARDSCLNTDRPAGTTEGITGKLEARRLEGCAHTDILPGRARRDHGDSGALSPANAGWHESLAVPVLAPL